MRVRTHLLVAALAACALGCPSSDPPTTPQDVVAAAEDVPDTAAPQDESTPDTADPGLACGKATEFVPDGALGVRITTPTGSGTLFASGAVAIGGVALGEGTWTWRLGDSSGEITPSGTGAIRAWQTEPIPLSAGDNWIEVVGVDAGGATVRDRLLVISSTAPLAGSRLELSPSTVYAGETHVVRASLVLPSLTPTSAALLPVDEDGAPRAGDSVAMADDGSGCGFDDKCDEIAGDRVYSSCISVSPTAGQRRQCFRPELTLPAGTLRLGVVCVDVAARVTRAQCEAATSALAQATPDNATTVLSNLQGLGALEIADTGYGVAARSPLGPQLVVPKGNIPEGARGTPVRARRAAVLGGTPGVADLEAAERHLRADRCPPITGAAVARGATVDAFRELGGAGVIALAAHGGPTLLPEPGGRTAGGSELLVVDQALDCSTFLDAPTSCSKDQPCPAGSTCVVLRGGSECVNPTQADVSTGRIALLPGALGISAAFVDRRLADALPGSLVWLGACRSVASGGLALAFLGAGAASVVGFQGFVSDAFVGELAERLFSAIGDGSATVAEALCSSTDPRFGGSPVLVGSPATSLDVTRLVGADFESGLFGWDRSGDARSVTAFCGQSALEGKRMALLSTGIGFGAKAGELSQTFCIPEGAKTLRFRWRYYSAELEGFCGASGGALQDQFDVRLERGSETITVKRCDVDDMCLYDVGGCLPKPCAPPSTGCGCGDCYQPYAPVEGCDLCGQPVQATGVVEETFNASALAGGPPVTLRIKLRDSGDGINDTVFLMDAIGLE